MAKVADIITPRLILREVTPEDGPDFSEYMMRKAYWLHLPFENTDPAKCIDYIRQRSKDRLDENRVSYFFAATRREDGRIIGEGELHVPAASAGTASIGWAVDSHETGKGFGTEIGQAMIVFGMDHLALEKVEARCRDINSASIRIMEKLGLSLVQSVLEPKPIRGEVWKTLVYSLEK